MSDDPPAPDYPELRDLDKKRPLPSLQDRRQEAPRSHHPAEPAPATTTSPSSSPQQVDVDSLGNPEEPLIPTVPGPEDPEESMEETIAALLAGQLDSPDQCMAEDADEEQEPHADEEQEVTATEATDEELAEAFQPLIEGTLRQALLNPASGLHAFLEPMLRSTVRRAIAEQMESSRQFRQLGAFDRLLYRLQALFTSRTYDDIVFERTHRYQVEEAYLLRSRDQALLSYAHHDPGCHVSTRRVRERLRELTSRLRAPDGELENSFDVTRHRLALVREGQYCLLVAVLRGRSNALVRADLDYVLRQVEDRFGDRLETQTDAFLRVLQPMLEGCLLIQSPAPPH